MHDVLVIIPGKGPFNKSPLHVYTQCISHLSKACWLFAHYANPSNTIQVWGHNAGISAEWELGLRFKQ